MLTAVVNALKDESYSVRLAVLQVHFDLHIFLFELRLRMRVPEPYNLKPKP